jgi:hypothetical protein
MSNLEASDPDLNSDSDTESFYSPINSSKTSETPNVKKRPCLLTSTSSDSPSPKVQNAVKKVRQSRTDTPPSTLNKMDAEMQNFFKDQILKSEGRIKNELMDVRKAMSDFKIEVIDRVNSVNTQVLRLKLELDGVTAQLRKKNLIIQGLPEKKDESWNDLENAIKELYEKLSIPGTPDFDDCFRLGKPAEGKIRPVILKLIRIRDKKMLLAQTRKLKGTKIFVNEDHSIEERKMLSILRSREKELRRDHPEARVYIRGKNLIFKKGLNSQIFFVNGAMQLEQKQRGTQDNDME